MFLNLEIFWKTCYENTIVINNITLILKLNYYIVYYIPTLYLYIVLYYVVNVLILLCSRSVAPEVWTFRHSGAMCYNPLYSIKYKHQSSLLIIYNLHL